MYYVSMSHLHIQVTEKYPLVHIVLNRPEALNALTHDMVIALTAALEAYRDDGNVKAVIVSGQGERAFCAGGDIKMVHLVGTQWIKEGRTGPNPAWRYFRDEFAMNALIHHYPKPVISLCHGYVMGGGYGIAGNGSHIVVCDDTRFAMPETGIGFFPDVGIGWKLARSPGHLGMAVALTGNIFGADLMMAAGLATHNVPYAVFLQIEQAACLEEIEALLDRHSRPATDRHAATGQHFDHDSLDEIFIRLQSDKSDFASELLKTLQSRSPMSLHVTFRHLQMAAGEDYDTAIARDYRLACAFFSRPDIYEGIRAAVIDKDKRPVWSHKEIHDISKADIDYYLNFSDYN